MLTTHIIIIIITVTAMFEVPHAHAISYTIVVISNSLYNIYNHIHIITHARACVHTLLFVGCHLCCRRFIGYMSVCVFAFGHSKGGVGVWCMGGGETTTTTMMMT